MADSDRWLGGLDAAERDAFMAWWRTAPSAPIQEAAAGAYQQLVAKAFAAGHQCERKTAELAELKAKLSSYLVLENASLRAKLARFVKPCKRDGCDNETSWRDRLCDSCGPSAEEIKLEREQHKLAHEHAAMTAELADLKASLSGEVDDG